MTVQVLVFTVDGRRCAVPAAAISEIVHAAAVQPLPGAPRSVDGLCRLRGKLVPVVSMRSRLRLTERALRSTDYFIVASLSGSPVALRVDDVLSLESASLEKVDVEHPSMRGLADLGDGLVLVHDVTATLDESERSLLRAAVDSVEGTAGG